MKVTLTIHPPDTKYLDCVCCGKLIIDRTAKYCSIDCEIEFLRRGRYQVFRASSLCYLLRQPLDSELESPSVQAHTEPRPQDDFRLDDNNLDIPTK